MKNKKDCKHEEVFEFVKNSNDISTDFLITKCKNCKKSLYSRRIKKR